MSVDLYSMFYIIETLGIIAFAISGMILARKKSFDIVGIYIIGGVTALGGGTIRDVMLDIQPLYWIQHSEYPLILLAIAILMASLKKVTIQEKWLVIPDAIGMAIFSITTAQMAIQMNLPIIIVGILSTVVAAFGGVLRDSLCQEIPMIFRKESTLYASLAFANGVAFAILARFEGLSQNLSLVICVIFTFLFRLIAYKYNLKFSLSK
ncbi:MAG: trimeric intracellular cation channel family protein [Candidatus Margulisiibacteriota bacterium]